MYNVDTVTLCLHLKSNYFKFITYDKELERKYALEEDYFEEESESEEEDNNNSSSSSKKKYYEELNLFNKIIRTEVRVKNGKLNSNKTNKKIDKTLESYYNEQMTTELYSKNSEEIYGTKDFYRIDVALKIIKESNFKESIKQKLYEVIKVINKYGFTSAKKKLTKKYSNETFKSYLKRIESLNINYITFGKRINGRKINREMIKNFSVLENGEKNL